MTRLTPRSWLGCIRGGYIKAVHHGESHERMRFKRRVALYHDRVRHRVREANRLMAQCRGHGVFVQERAFADEAGWRKCRAQLPKDKMLRSDLQLLWSGYISAAIHVVAMRERVIARARKEPMIRRLTGFPVWAGFGHRRFSPTLIRRFGFARSRRFGGTWALVWSVASAAQALSGCGCREMRTAF